MDRRSMQSTRAFLAASVALVAACGNHSLADTGAPLVAHAVDFPSVPVVPLGAAPSAIAVADLNGDGRLDLVAAMGAAGVTVSLGWEGGFAPPSAIPAGYVSALVTGDFDRDG